MVLYSVSIAWSMHVLNGILKTYITFFGLSFLELVPAVLS